MFGDAGIIDVHLKFQWLWTNQQKGVQNRLKQPSCQLLLRPRYLYNGCLFLTVYYMLSNVSV